MAGALIAALGDDFEGTSREEQQGDWPMLSRATNPASGKVSL